MTADASSFRFAAYWGACPDKDDTAQTLEFSTRGEVDAWLKGVNEADGWMDVSFVAHPHFRVDGEGNFVETLGGKKAPDPVPGRVHVIWGEEPEKGSTPDTYDFSTPAEAEAFCQGAQDMVGWTKCFLVPSDAFKPYEDIQSALTALDGEARQALQRCLDENEELPGVDDNYVFVREDGAFVNAYWDVDDPIENVPLTPEQWRAQFDQRLKAVYSITVEDAGLSEADLESWRRGPFERLPAVAVEAYAVKYALTPNPAPGRPYL